jgi:hypothetical protein
MAREMLLAAQFGVGPVRKVPLVQAACAAARQSNPCATFALHQFTTRMHLTLDAYDLPLCDGLVTTGVCTQIVDAFNYACIVPGFFMATIGGINGEPHVLVN